MNMLADLFSSSRITVRQELSETREEFQMKQLDFAYKINRLETDILYLKHEIDGIKSIINLSF